MDYAEIKAYNNCKSDKPYSKDLKVKYANILLESCEQGKLIKHPVCLLDCNCIIR